MNRNKKLFYSRTGSGNGFSLPLEDGVRANAQEETDDEYISEQLRQGRQKKLEQARQMEYRRFFYGRPAPRLAQAHLAAIKSALAFFDAPVAKEIEGTGRGVRAKLFSHIDCVFCHIAFRRVDKEQFLAHVSMHHEIRDYLQFVDRARRDYESLKMRKEELESQADKVRNRLRSAIAIARNLRSEEKALVRRLAEQGAIDQHSMNMLAGGESDDDFVVVKENDELKSIRKQALAAEERERKESSQLQRNLVERRAVDRQIETFERSIDTEDVAKGRAGDYDVIARLLQEQDGYLDPLRSAALKKATYLPLENRFVEPIGGSKY